MKLVVFGLTVTSAWGNGHATLWRGLSRALERRGHRVVFFERDLAYYAAHRDLQGGPGLEVVLYRRWAEVSERATRELNGAEAAMVTSFCPDAQQATDLVLSTSAEVRCYYDLDTPVTLSALERNEHVPYLPRQGLAEFDLVLSYTGGRALHRLRDELGAKHVAPLYGSVDPEVHKQVAPSPRFAADLSYLGTYSEDRQGALAELFLAPADVLDQQRFLIAGAQYPADFPWRRNVWFARHLSPGDHAAFFASSRATLNVTRAPMARLGYCPSPRLFEAAACGVATVSDSWEGIEQFFVPGEEILLARDREEVVFHLSLPRTELQRTGRRARERALSEHTADHRAAQLEELLFRVPPQGVQDATKRAECSP